MLIRKSAPQRGFRAVSTRVHLSAKSDALEAAGAPYPSTVPSRGDIVAAANEIRPIYGGADRQKAVLQLQNLFRSLGEHPEDRPFNGLLVRGARGTGKSVVLKTYVEAFRVLCRERIEHFAEPPELRPADWGTKPNELARLVIPLYFSAPVFVEVPDLSDVYARDDSGMKVNRAGVLGARDTTGLPLPLSQMVVDELLQMCGDESLVPAWLKTRIQKELLGTEHIGPVPEELEWTTWSEDAAKRGREHLNEWLRRNGVSVLVVLDEFQEIYRTGVEFSELPAEVFRQVRNHVYRCHVQMATTINDPNPTNVSLALAGSSPWADAVMWRDPPDWSADIMNLPLLPGTRPAVHLDRMKDVILRSPTSKAGFAWMLEHAIDTRRLSEDSRKALKNLAENGRTEGEWTTEVEVRGESFSAADAYDLTAGRPREIEFFLENVFRGHADGVSVFKRMGQPAVSASKDDALAVLLHDMIASCIFAKKGFRSFSANDRVSWSGWDDSVSVDELVGALRLVKQHFGDEYGTPLVKLAESGGKDNDEREQLLRTFAILAESGDVDWDPKEARGIVRLPSPWAGMRAVDRMFAQSANMSEKVVAWLRNASASTGRTAEPLVAMALCRKTDGGASTALADALDGEMAVWHHALEGEERERVKATIVDAVRELSAGNVNLMRPELEKAKFDAVPGPIPVAVSSDLTSDVKKTSLVVPWKEKIDNEGNVQYMALPEKAAPLAFLRGQIIGLKVLPTEVAGWTLVAPSDDVGADLIAVHKKQRVVVTVQVKTGSTKFAPGETEMARNKLRMSRGSLGLESLGLEDGKEDEEQGVGLFGRRWLYVDVLAVTRPFSKEKFGSGRSSVRDAWGKIHFAESEVREVAEWTRRQWDPEVSLVLSKHELRDMWPPELVLAGAKLFSDAMLCGEDAEDVVKKYSKQTDWTLRPGLVDKLVEKAKEEEEAKEREREELEREREELERERKEQKRFRAVLDREEKAKDLLFQALEDYGIGNRAVHLKKLVDAGVTPELLRDAARVSMSVNKICEY